MDVLADHPEIGRVGIVHHLRFVPTLEKMAPQFVPGIVPLGKSALKPLHGIDQVSGRRFDQQVVVVAHQAPGVHPHLVAFAHLAQTADKQVGIRLALENIPALVPAAHQMIPRTGILDSQGSGHAGKVIAPDPKVNRNP